MHSACLQLKNRPPPPPPPPLQRSIGPSVRIAIGSVGPIIRDVCNDGCIWNNGTAELTLGMIVVSDLRSGPCLPGPATVGTMLAALTPAPPSLSRSHRESCSYHQSALCRGFFNGCGLAPPTPFPAVPTLHYLVLTVRVLQLPISSLSGVLYWLWPRSPHPLP